MEVELICGKCEGFLEKPVNLPCSHNICYTCAEQCTIETESQEKSNRRRNISTLTSSPNLNDRSDCQSDDSGYLSMLEIHACLHQQLQGPIKSIKCPKCSVSFILDDRGVNCLPRNLILDYLVERHKKQSSEVSCQLCEKTPPVKATFMCEQCRVSYCDSCLAICHPKRGPLLAHSLVSPSAEITDYQPRGVFKCTEHEDENISMYCSLCKMPVCYLCFEQGRHCGHEAKALGTVFKEHKVEMKRDIEVLQNKNKELEKFIETLDISVMKAQENSVDFESQVVAQIDEVIAKLDIKKQELLASIASTVQTKITSLKEQKEKCDDRLTATKGLLEYTNEAIKESDHATFLLISNSLCSRLTHTIETWIGKHGLKPCVSSEMDMALTTEEILNTITNCNFLKEISPRRVDKPDIPFFVTENCTVVNNTLTLVWESKTDKSTPVDEFAVEVDDGMGGKYQDVHHTDEMTCTLGGLQFCSTYRARIRAINSSGASEPSEVIYLTTPAVAVFNLDPELSHTDIVLSNDNTTITSTSFENRVALADVGFSRGVHYWEVRIDRYECNPDPALGVAQEDCTKDAILGKDAKAWSVYVDSTRSWFQHNNAHLYRSEGGIGTGSTMGLLLDLDHCLLTFYCNGKKNGPIEFPSLQNVDVVYPAFSLNRNVKMTLSTGLSPPDF